jgi:hypothetical protein
MLCIIEGNSSIQSSWLLVVPIEANNSVQTPHTYVTVTFRELWRKSHIGLVGINQAYYQLYIYIRWSPFEIVISTVKFDRPQSKHPEDGFGGLVVCMLASGFRVRGFKPGRSRWIFSV